MKIRIFGLIFFLFLSCATKKNIEGTYKLTEKVNIYNIVLKLNKGERFSLQTISTIGAGITEGDWKQEKDLITLIPDRPIIEKMKEGDSVIEMEKYRPFSDTMKIKIKGNKLCPENKKFCLRRQ